MSMGIKQSAGACSGPVGSHPAELVLLIIVGKAYDFDFTIPRRLFDMPSRGEGSKMPGSRHIHDKDDIDKRMMGLSRLSHSEGIISH